MYRAAIFRRNHHLPFDPFELLRPGQVVAVGGAGSDLTLPEADHAVGAGGGEEVGREAGGIDGRRTEVAGCYSRTDHLHTTW